ncbi:type I restriction enzyme HsdR N-terminal domain-containing protein [Undibacterium sp. CY18W]|uniref:Type I restriction enzyme HsdR N-terminal domain-containing protein n=1 Tax=Undibacterium hunanense TaxID=2762292 RepID=A0ABR6ZKK7_9BURK|nr:type I restriction endonuclease [Undibacterium hunanense]MBC3916435.1 type I restriction enzyme HsdR N-terminal domain-containing protein [Undibacterium hunanense]
MDFIDQIRSLAARIMNTKDIVQTEEATKNAMVMPFIQALGYNVFDPLEVTPELIADVGTKKGEKVDYAILRDGKPIILFECKKCGGDLSINHASQLFRYFHVTEARFGILTNGIVYRFFTDLEQPNKMDEKPFLEFNILDFKEQDIEELKKFAKSAFDLERILNTANELKYTRAIQHVLSEWMTNPSEEFVRLVSADLLAGKRFTPAVKDQFSQITKRAFQQLIGDRINDRLKVAMTPEISLEPEEPLTQAVDKNDPNAIITTPEEIEGLHIVRAILREVVGPRRIVMRDAQSYCAILLDDNNRKPICRLRFNNTERLVLGLFSGKEEEKFPISELDDIYNHTEKLKQTATAYLQQNEGN